MLKTVTVQELRNFMAARETDLVIAPHSSPCELILRGQFNGYGDFFSVGFSGVEYIDLANGITVCDVRLMQAEDAFSSLNKWSWLKGLVSGPALVLRTAESESWEQARPDQLFLVVANQIELSSGSDWERECARLNLS